MSSDSLAVFRKRLGPELNALAEEHLKHEYAPSTSSGIVNKYLTELPAACDNQTETPYRQQQEPSPPM